MSGSSGRKPVPSPYLDIDEDDLQWLNSERAKEIIRSGNWWALVPKEVEFRYIIHGLVRDYIGHRPTPQDVLVLWPFEDDTELVLLSRQRVPVAALSARFGLDFASFDPTRMIILAGTVEPAVVPTVAYWGEA